MRRRTRGATILTLASLALLACAPETKGPVEVGRWVDESVNSLFIVYHMSEDVPEVELARIQGPIARQHATNRPFVTQVTVHDAAWAAKLVTDEMRRRIIDNELPIGSDLVLDESMTVRGGLVYTYYKNGDHDELIYHERDGRQHTE